MVISELVIDDELAKKLKELGKHETLPDAIQIALTEYVERLQRMQIFELFGTIDYDPEYDYKAQRNRS